MSKYRRCVNCINYKSVPSKRYCKVKGFLPLFRNTAKSCKYFEYKIDLSKMAFYRQSHPRCRYCDFLFYENKPERLGVGSGYFKCKLKEKVIGDVIFFSVKGMFCQWFEVGDDKIDEV